MFDGPYQSLVFYFNNFNGNRRLFLRIMAASAVLSLLLTKTAFSQLGLFYSIIFRLLQTFRICNNLYLSCRRLSSGSTRLVSAFSSDHFLLATSKSLRNHEHPLIKSDKYEWSHLASERVQRCAIVTYTLVFVLQSPAITAPRPFQGFILALNSFFPFCTYSNSIQVTQIYTFQVVAVALGHLIYTGYIYSRQFDKGKWTGYAPGVVEQGWFFWRRIDLSDTQWREFRSAAPALITVLLIFAILSRWIQRRWRNKISSIGQQPGVAMKARAWFIVGFAALFMTYVHGYTVVYVFALVAGNWKVAQLVGGTKLG